MQFFDLFFDCQGEGACWTDQDVLEGDLGWTQWHCLGQAGEESDIDTRQYRPGGSDFHFSCEHFVSRPALITSAKSRTGKRRPKCKGVLRSTYFRSNSIISIHLCLTDSPLRKLDRGTEKTWLTKTSKLEKDSENIVQDQQCQDGVVRRMETLERRHSGTLHDWWQWASG